MFAIHSWCDFLRQIAIPLKMFNFARVDLDEIFVEILSFGQDVDNPKRQSCRYVLGRLENQSAENEDTYLMISALAMAAWRYYSILAENGVIVDRNGNDLKHAKGINHFKTKSNLYWKSEELKEMGLRVTSAEAETVLLKSVLPTVETSEIWKDSMEFQIAVFTARFTIDYMHKGNSWDAFDHEWDNVCHDWVEHDQVDEE